MTLDLFLVHLHFHRMKISMQHKYLISALCVLVFSQLKVATKHQSVGMHLIEGQLHRWPSKHLNHATHVVSSFHLQAHFALHLAYALMQSPLMMHAWSQSITAAERIAKQQSHNPHA
jgi:cytochrome c oxidase subunit IV